MSRKQIIGEKNHEREFAEAGRVGRWTGSFWRGAGGSALVQVVTQPGCAWSVTEGLSCLTITSARSGHGPANIAYYIAPNPTHTARTPKVER